MKRCTICETEKEICEFPKKGKNTYRSKCKICFNKRKKELTDMRTVIKKQTLKIN